MVYYSKATEDNSWICELCPNYCHLKSEQLGLCGVRICTQEGITTTDYNKITAIAIDPIEKKPLRFFHPGHLILSVGGRGCNLSCKFCQNHHIAKGHPNTHETSIEELLEQAKSIDGNIGIAFTYNEPTINYEFVLDTFKAFKKAGLKTVLVTNAYLNPEPFRALLAYTDALNIDLKSYENSFYETVCGGTLDTVKENIKIASQVAHVEVTYLAIDHLNTDYDAFEELCQWLSNIDAGMPLHISRYFPNYMMDNPPTEIETLKILRSIAEKYLKRVLIGNVPIQLLW